MRSSLKRSFRRSFLTSNTCRRVFPPLPHTGITPPPGHWPTFPRHMSDSATDRSNPTSEAVLFHAIDDAEDIHGYYPGGYHTVNINDRLNDRYRVLHKLGHGSHATVWLARDERLQRLVAVKVCIAEASRRESEVLSRLRGPLNSGDKSVISGRDVIPAVFDTFRIEGPHGTHICIVNEVARCNLADAKRRSWGMPMHLPVARVIAAQFVLAVAYMHSKGYVHGDLHEGNILLRHLARFRGLSDQEIYNEFGEPEHETVKTFDNKPIPENVPTAVVLPVRFPSRTNEFSLVEADILLSDFGESYRPEEEERLVCRAPVHCRPPEDRFEPLQPRSYPSDIWTLACSIWGIMGVRSLFESFMPTEDRTARYQVELLGKFPPEWWARWEARSEYFTDDGKLLTEERDAWTWEGDFESAIQEHRRTLGMELMSLEEKEALLAMLKPMLAYKPEDRCSASDVVKSKWMTDWAMPEYEIQRTMD